MGLNEIIKIGDRIKNLRKKEGLTQKDMAQILKIPYSTYSNYENNNREPNKELLEKIADVLHVSIDFLIYGDLKETSGVTIALHNDDGIDSELPEEAKKEIENFIEYVKNKYKK